MPVITPTGGGGGSGFTPARNVGQVELDWSGSVTLADALKAVALTYGGGDASLVDLSTPAAPKIVTAGVYAFTVTASVNPSPASECVVSLVVDDNFYSLTPTLGISGPPSDYPTTFIAATWWNDAADPFILRIGTQTTPGSESLAGRLLIQRIV